MVKKVVIISLAILLVVSIAAGLWVRSVFAHDGVRTALAEQLSSALGQPVSIGSISAGIYPRVTVRLTKVAIGEPVRIQAGTLRLGTNLRALLSRQIVHGTVYLDDAKVQLPLPPFRTSSSTTSSGSPVQIVSIDDIVLKSVEIVSGGRTLRGDVEVAPHGDGATLRRISLSADDTTLEGSGEISNLAGPVGEIAMKARRLNLTKLLDFLTAFSSGSGMTGRTASAPPSSRQASTNLTMSLVADRATMGELALEKLNARARITPAAVTLDPIAFGVFGGDYRGTMALTSSGAAPTLRLNAAVSNVDVASAMAFAGNPGTVSGRLSGRIDLATQTAASNVIDAARGTVRVEVRDGVVKNLGLVRTVVIATSMRSDAPSPLKAAGSTDEPFTMLAGTFALANGSAHTNDLQFQSPDLLLRAGGSLRLDGSQIDLKGDVQLSDALSQQAGRDLFRYTQEQGRVTLPATITGPARSPSVRVDVAGVATRAVQNKAKDELKKALGRIIK